MLLLAFEQGPRGQPFNHQSLYMEVSKRHGRLYAEPDAAELAHGLVMALASNPYQYFQRPAQTGTFLTARGQARARTITASAHEAIAAQRAKLFEVFRGVGSAPGTNPAPKRRSEHPDGATDGGDAGANGGGGLRVEEDTFTVRFGDRALKFDGRSRRLFALLARVARRPGHRVLFDDLRAKGDMWDDLHVEDGTIRGAVTRLRARLREAGMEDLCTAISTGNYQNRAYVLLDLPE
jgi:hypothetical protein